MHKNVVLLNIFLITGIFKVPKKVCAVQYARAILEFGDKNNCLEEIHIVDINSEMISIVQKIFNIMLIERKPAPDCLQEFVKFVDKPVERTDEMKAHGETGISENIELSTMDQQDGQKAKKTTVKLVILYK